MFEENVFGTFLFSFQKLESFWLFGASGTGVQALTSICLKTEIKISLYSINRTR